MKLCPKRRLRRAATLVEVLTAGAMTVIVLTGAVSAMIAGMDGWARGQGLIDAQSYCQRAIRAVSAELREAMSVTVDGDGRGLSYRLPVKDGNGNFVVPPVWDNIERRIEYSEGNLRIKRGNSYRTIAKNLILTDPLSNNGASAIQVFTPGSGSITRQVTVFIAVRTYGQRKKMVATRSRETIYLRNIPVLTN